MLNKKSHKCYKLMYHLIIVVKYRKNVFTQNNIISDLKQKIIDISTDFDISILDQGIDSDHVHMLFETNPNTNITKYINILKGHTSRFIRKKYKDFLSNKLWGDSFWSNSYYLATTGNVNLTNLITYMEKQEQ